MRKTIFFFFLIHLPAVGTGQPAEQSSPILTFYTAASFTQGEFCFSLSVVSDSSIWYTTNKGVYRFDGQHVLKHLDASLFHQSQIEVLLIDALSDENVWVLGHDSKTWKKTMYHFNGKEWRRIAFPQAFNDPNDDLVVFKLRMFSHNQRTFGYAAGQDGLVYKYDGASWKIIPRFSTETLRALRVYSHDNVWAGGKNGAMFHFDGVRWSQTTLSDTAKKMYFFDVAFLSDTNVWAAGSEGVAHYDGHTWKFVSSPAKAMTTAIIMLSHNNGWAITEKGMMLHYDGNSWSIFKQMSRDAGLATMQATRQDKKFTLYFHNTEGIVASVWGIVPSFTDASASSNIHLYGGNALMADYDNNGTGDLLTSAIGSFPDRIYSNRGDGFFTEVTNQLHPANAPPAYINTIADLDNNGFTDIYQMQFPSPDVWYRNSGSWKFTPVTSPVPTLTNNLRSVTQFADMDADGDLDLVYMHSQPSDVQWPFTIYTNDGIGNFSNPRPVGRPIIAGGITYSFFIANLNEDNIPDLFKFNLGDKCELYFYNNAEVRDSATWAGVDGTVFGVLPNISWGSPVDVNHDGSLDIFLISRTGKAAFFLNNGKGKFTLGDSLIFDPQGENPKGEFVDLDCDGDMDLFLVDRFYKNENGTLRPYKEVSFRQTSNPTFNDFDDDGDPDVVTSAYRDNGRLYVLKNEINPANAVKVSVRGIRSNAFGIGARVALWKFQHNGKELIDTREVSSSDPLYFYINPDEQYDLSVIFPSGIEVQTPSILPGKYDITEFSFPMNYAWDFYYSLQRSWKYTNGTLEIIKLFIFLGICFASYRISKRFKVERYLLHPMVIAAIILLYILTIHATVRNGMVLATFISLALVLITNAGCVAAARSIVLRREANYVSHFRLLELLGEGGMGKVFKASDSITKNIVAVKVLNPAIMKDSENKKRLRNEGNILSSFSHPHIVKVFEIGETETQSFIAMEYLPGGTLRQHLEKTYPLPVKELVRIFTQICDGVSEIHSRDIVHRDLKTGNIMLDDKNNIRIMDFGLSKSPLVTTMTTLGTVIGTLGYVSPEQVTSMNVDHRADIFSLGVVLYELLTRQLPFKGENEIAVIHSIFNTVPPTPSSLSPGIPFILDGIVFRCLQKNPDDRYQTVNELRIALEKEFC